MGLRADAQSQAFHGQEVLRLRHHDPQVVQLEKDAEFPAIAEESLHAIVEPIGLNARLHGHPRRSCTNLAGRTKQPVDVLGGRAGGIGETHHGPAHQKQLPLGARTAQLFVEQPEEPSNVPVGERGHPHPKCPLGGQRTKLAWGPFISHPRTDARVDEDIPAPEGRW